MELFYAGSVTTKYIQKSFKRKSRFCIAANGTDICGRTDAVACPRQYPFGTRVVISGMVYECVDRTASKYDGRFDISFDKDLQGALNFGKQYLKVEIL